MESSILKSIKKVLGLADTYTVFDQDIIMYINSAFSTLSQLGVGYSVGFLVEDEDNEWEELDLPQIQLNMVKTFIQLKVRMLFDPPTTSYLIDAMNKQIDEFVWRLNVMRENEIPIPVTATQGSDHDW